MRAPRLSPPPVTVEATVLGNAIPKCCPDCPPGPTSGIAHVAVFPANHDRGPLAVVRFTCGHTLTVPGSALDRGRA